MFGGHWLELFGLLIVGLLIFGPKKVIEMGSSLGKALRELREATKGMSWTSLTGEESPGQTTLSRLSQLSQSLTKDEPPPPSTLPDAVPSASPPETPTGIVESQPEPTQASDPR
ncbi:MAG TPA: twin-arginine translocase TatA/TatE family subunit [Ktedonobacterales bacterium]|nr:twin-arginine translocase TatA/TatE family subunit [Ktedonobacterales bacterium]